MSLMIVIGLLGMILVLFFKRPIIDILNEDHKLVHKLKNAIWFQNHWLSGCFLLIMNTLLFLSTCLVLFGLMYVITPYVHLFVMFLAVIGSIYLWVVINKAWEGTKRNRLKMGTIGSSFYLALAIIFLYMLVTLEPSYPGEDTFMKAIGLLFAFVIATVAFITCFVFTGFPKKNQ